MMFYLEERNCVEDCNVDAWELLEEEDEEKQKHWFVAVRSDDSSQQPADGRALYTGLTFLGVMFLQQLGQLMFRHPCLYTSNKRVICCQQRIMIIFLSIKLNTYGPI